MRGIDFQIHFERIIQEMSDALIDKERPDTYTIYSFINQAQIRYLNEKYLNMDVTKSNIESIRENSGDLNGLIKTAELSASLAPAGSYYGEAKYISLPDDYVFYIRSDSRMKRTDAIVVDTETYVPNKVLPYSDIERVLSTPWNYPILRNPIVVFEENDRIYVIYDKYTNSLRKVSLTYLRRPYDFNTNYEEFNNPTTVASVPAGTKMRALTQVQYITDDWKPIGTYITKMAGFNSINGTVCTPHDAISITDECEFSYHTHNDILQLAVNIYVEEAKFRLNIKADKQGSQ